MSQNSKRRIYLGLAIFAIFQIILWPTSNYSLAHPLEYLVGYFTVVILPTAVLTGTAIYFIESRWPDQSKQAKARRAVAKRQTSLRNRLENEGIFKTIQNIGERLIYRIIVPTAYFLDRYFGDVRWVHEHMIAVTRRYLVLPIAQVMEYPDRKNGYFLHITDYLWRDDHVTFVFEPTMGIIRASKAIIKRLSHYDEQLAGKAHFQQGNNQLYVTLPTDLFVN